MAQPVLKDVRKILIMNLGGMGDLFLSFPAMNALREAYKGARIDIMGVDRVCELAGTSGYFDRTFIYKKSGLRNIVTLVKLRKNKYDIAVNMRTMTSWIGVLKIFIIMGIIGPRIRAGLDTNGRGFFFDIKIPEDTRNEKYEMEYGIDIARSLGAPVNDNMVHFNVGQTNMSRMKSILEENGIRDGDRVIGINAGGMPSRRWPIENIKKVIQLISRIKPCIFVLTGSENERSYVEQLMSVNGAKVINLAGRIGLLDLCALIKRCDLYISNDTGPMHIAAVLGRPLIAVFGPGSVVRYDPRKISDRAVVLYKSISCAPCNRFYCSQLACLKAITPGEVIDAAKHFLGKDI